MAIRYCRREFLNTSAATTAIVGLGELVALAQFSPASAAEMKLAPHDVRLSPDIEPLVRLIERTPREQSVGMIIDQLSKGLSYRQFLAGLFLAAIRSRSSPHHVHMIHAAQSLSFDVPHEERLLPLFWALDTMQSSGKEGTRYPKVNVRLVSSPEKAAAELDDAMRKYDFLRAEAAIVALARSEGARQAMGRLWHYVGRDDSGIGHRAIALSNAWRTLDTIGWRHAEPILQFVIRLLNGTKKLKNRLYDTNVERARKAIGNIPADWAGRRVDAGATLELLDILRNGDARAACRWSFDALSAGQVQATAVWDAIYLVAAEFMVRFTTSKRIALLPLHTNTSTNALRFAFEACDDPQTRLCILLQAVAWASGFIDVEKRAGYLREMKITEVTEVDAPDSPEKAIEEIFSLQPQRSRISSGKAGTREDMDKATQLTFAFAKRYADHRSFLMAARRLVCLKSTVDAHDFKFPTAIFENYRLVSPQWRPHLLAASTHWLHGVQQPDNPAVREAREALSKE